MAALCLDFSMLSTLSHFQDRALHVAVKAGNKVMLKELLRKWMLNNQKSQKHQTEHDPNKNVNVIFRANKEGENPLTIAIKANERWVIHNI